MNGQAFIILLVEDDLNDQELFKYAVGKSDTTARLAVACDGEEAIAYLAGTGVFAERERHPFPDLVVLDLNLPKVSGIDVVRWIRAQPALKALPVTILSSSAETTDVETAYAAGANSYLVKSSELGILTGIVRGLCEQARIRAEFRGAEAP